MNKRTPLRTTGLFAALGLASFLLANCNDDEKKTTTPTEQSLYMRLGGKPAITSVIDTFLVEVLHDDLIKARFNSLPPQRVANLRGNLIDLVETGTKGPESYMGLNMAAAHKGMGVTEAEFNALVGDLITSLDKHKVPEKEKNELLAILGPMKADIVGK